jgi:endothelin-converting enzyme
MVHYKKEEEQSLQSSQVLVNNEDTVNSWPPWPWPPWGDDDDGNGGDRPGGPKNATQLAEEVVKFERKLAQASLDLSGHFEKDPIQMLMVAQRHLIPGSSIHLQQGSHFQHH